MSVLYAVATAAVLLVAYRVRGPKAALGALVASAALYLALLSLITSSMQ